MRGPQTKRPSAGRLILALALAAALLAALRVLAWRPFPVVGEAPADGFTRIAGVVHVHTTLSDGGGTPEEVIAAARAAGLGFLAITDHNLLDAKLVEGYHDGLLVLVGAEASTTAGHILGLGIPDPAFRFSGDARDALEDVLELGGRAFAAHPTSPREDFRFSGWDLPGAWGLELLNGDSQWREAGTLRLLRTAALYGLNRDYALLTSLTSPRAALERWDALARQRDVAGIAGADAHSRLPLRRDRALRFPSYQSLFALAQNHVLLQKPLTRRAGDDVRTLVDALANGHAYVGLDALAPADGFFFDAEAGGQRSTMGDTVPAFPPPTLRAGGRVPKGARLRLLRDGAILTEAEGALEAKADAPGVYRVEARVPGWDVPWVLTNPIYVFDPGRAEERSRAAAWPVEATPPEPAVILDTFEGKTLFSAEADPSSAANPAVLAPQAGADGRTAGRLEFRLGVPGPGHPHASCALVNREKRDLAGRSGLVLWLRGDGVYRVWIQVRDENPASADEGTEWWFASLKTTAAWRRVAVPFARFRSINEKSDGRLDLDKVRMLAFVLDPGAVKPGTQGTIWLDDVGVY